MLHNIRDTNETALGFSEELDTFNFSLTILDFEIQNGSAVPEVQGWSKTELLTLLANARKTFFRLQTILQDVRKRRSILPGFQQYLCTNLHEQEIRRLWLRIIMYTSAFNIPVVLLAIYSTRNPARRVDRTGVALRMNSLGWRRLEVLS
ncbi:MAG: hypothetical protein M1813_009637 [Trichoglossum hirsutum]|nr:MAG: hypothetical protein M1813_009637 [Trichoglossum hirsutum]